MGLFSKKRKVSNDEFCEELYTCHVFSPPIGGTDPHLFFSESVRGQVSSVDPTFASVANETLAVELLAMRIEVIGITWSHRTNEELALAQSEFTKSFLDGTSRSALWADAGEYNQAVAESAMFGVDADTRLGRAQITMNNQMRVGLFDAWIDEGRDPEAAARVANRVGSKRRWKEGVTQELLAAKLNDRLGLAGNLGSLAVLAATALGFYRGADEALGEVSLVV